MKKLLAVLALALAGQLANAQPVKMSDGPCKMDGSDCGGGTSLPGLTPGGVVVATGPGTVGTDAGLDYDSTTKALVLGNSLSSAGSGLIFGTNADWDPRIAGYGSSLQFLILGGHGYAPFVAGNANIYGYLNLDGTAGAQNFAPGVLGVTVGTPTPAFTGRVATLGIQGTGAKTLTLGSKTDFVRVNFPASSVISVKVSASLFVTVSAAPAAIKTMGAEYNVSAYRLATGNAVAATPLESNVTGLSSTGSALSDAITVTGDADGILIGTNVAAGTGLTAPNTGTINYTVDVNGSGGTLIVVSQL